MSLDIESTLLAEAEEKLAEAASAIPLVVHGAHRNVAPGVEQAQNRIVMVRGALPAIRLDKAIGICEEVTARLDRAIQELQVLQAMVQDARELVSEYRSDLYS